MTVRRLRRLLPRALPAWQAIALQAPQTDVRVELNTGQATIDVTDNNVIAALDPLTIAIGITSPLNTNLSARLRLIDRCDAGLLGELALRRAGEWNAAGAQLDLFEVTRGYQHCISWARQRWNRWLNQRAVRTRPQNSAIPLTPDAVDCASIFYMCPRPVVLVGVDDGAAGNLFPMDLIGPVAGGAFMLALRLKSDSIAIMLNSRQIVLADMPPDAWPGIRMLGSLRRGQRVDWSALPFGEIRSQRFALRAPASARRVRELEIVDSRAVGSHCFFRANVVSESQLSMGTQLFHTSGLYQHLRRQQRREFEAVT